MRARTLVGLGTALAVLSLGLPWRFIVGTPGFLTSGYYTNYCYYDYFGTYVCETSFTPGVFVPGLPGGAYPGTASAARFFIVAAVALALVGGLYVGSARALRWAAYTGAAGVLLYAFYGLMGGLVAMAAASVCFWFAARRRPQEAREPAHR
jgi:hypothetical protein